MEYERPWSVFSIIGFILSFFGLLALLGIVLSAIGISETSYGKKKGRGLAIAGLVIGIIIFSASLITILGVLIVLPISGILNPATVDESFANGQMKVVVSGIGFDKELDYNRTIILEINGIGNRVKFLNASVLSMAKLNGINNELAVCDGLAGIIERNGINNKIVYLDC